MISCERRGAVRALLLVSTISALGAAPGCGLPSSRSGSSSGPSGGEVVATGAESALVVLVNGRPLTRADFFARVLDKAGSHAIRQEIIDDELFLQAASELGIELTDDDVSAAVDRFVQGMAEERGGLTDLTRDVEARGMTLEEFRLDLGPQLRTEIIRRQVARAMRKVDDDMLRAYYGETYKKKRYQTRHIAYSFLPGEGQTAADENRLKLEALSKAQRAIQRIREGSDFATLARSESDDEVTSRAGGALGAISEDSPLPPVFKEAIFALAPGDVSEPVENPKAPGIHIFQVTAVIPSESYVDCVDRMRKELTEREPTQQEVAEVLDTLRRRAKVEWKT